MRYSGFLVEELGTMENELEIRDHRVIYTYIYIYMYVYTCFLAFLVVQEALNPKT